VSKKTRPGKAISTFQPNRKGAVEEFQRRGLATIKPNVDFFSAPVYHMMGFPEI